MSLAGSAGVSTLLSATLVQWWYPDARLPVHDERLGHSFRLYNPWLLYYCCTIAVL